MARGRHSREEVAKAYAGICRQTCQVCGTRCPTDHVYSHVFTHCGHQVVHALQRSNLEPVTIHNPRNVGYAVPKRCLEFTGSGSLQVTCIKRPHEEASHWGKDFNGMDVVWQSVTLAPPRKEGTVPTA